MPARQAPDGDSYATEPRSIDLRDYWLIVRRRWVLVLVFVVIGAVGGAGYAVTMAPSYSATAQVVVTGVTQGPLSQQSQSSNLQVNMSTEQAVAQSPPVIERAAVIMGVPAATLEGDASKRLTIAVPANSLTTSNVLQITWDAGSAESAQVGANAFASAYLGYRHQELTNTIASTETVLKSQESSLQKQIASLTTQISHVSQGSSQHQSLSIKLNELTNQASTAATQLASLPTYSVTGGSVIKSARPLSPSGIGHTVILAIGGLLGLLIGLTLAFVRDVFDDRVRDSAALERKLGAATLAILPLGETDAGNARAGQARRQVPEISIVANPGSRAAESVRALRATLVAVAARRNLRTLLVVGADASVSSGRIVAELGVALAESGRRVLLVATDMRGSSLPQIFDVPNTTGLSDLLVGGGDPEVLTRQPKQAAGIPLPGAIIKRLGVLPSGPQMPNSFSILDSGAMLGMLESQRDAYEFVVLDCPLAAGAADVLSLAAHVDAVVVVAREARTRGRTVEDLHRRLDQVGALLIGGVFIDKGSSARHRHRSGGPQQPVPTLSVASTERREAAERRQAEPVRRPPPVTRPMPAVPADPPKRASGGLAKRQL